MNQILRERLQQIAKEQRKQEKRRAKKARNRARRLKKELSIEGRLIAETRLKMRQMNEWARLEAEIRERDRKTTETNYE